MSSAKKQLVPGEILILAARQHPLVLFRPVLLNLIALTILAALSIKLSLWWILLFCIAPISYLLWEYAEWRSREYLLTDRRIVSREGVFSVLTFDAPLDKINNVFHQQSLIGRLLKYGRVGLETASEQGTTLFEHLSRPLDFKNAIVHQRELYRNPVSTTNTGSSIPQLIQELASLRDRHVITADEFEAKKRALLDKL